MFDNFGLKAYYVVMRLIKICEGEYYHIYNRGVDKKDTFLDKRDYARFLFCVLFFQSPVTINNVSYHIGNFIKHSVFDNSERTRQEIIKSKYIELVSFMLMPNHFHLIVKEKVEGGISQYMQRIQNSYTKYFNTKYKKSGHLFQGPYQIVHIETDEQLIYLSSYIHRNCRVLKGWKNKEERYPWSSYADFLGFNRFEGLLHPEIITSELNNPKEYKDIVEDSGAKDLDQELLIE